MGGGISRSSSKLPADDSITIIILFSFIFQENSGKKYDEDAVDAANLAIAIQKEDFTTNIELSISCQNLPKMDAFSLTDPMVAVFQEKEF